MFNPTELLACPIVHFSPYAHRSSPCHLPAPDAFEAADDDSVAVFSSAAGVTCGGGVETGCFACHDGCEAADVDPVPVFSSGARVTRIGCVESVKSNAFGGAFVYGTNCRSRSPFTATYLPGTEASAVTAGGCKDADVFPAPELVVAGRSKRDCVWFTEIETI